MGTSVVDKGVAFIPKKVQGYDAKLLVGVYDLGTQKLDAARTYSIELMQTSADMTREDVIALLDSVSRAQGADVPGDADQLSDQGKS